MSMSVQRNLNVSMSPQDIYTQSAVKHHPLGSRLDLGGDVYHYCKAQEALTLGNLLTWTPSDVAVAATKFDVTAIGATKLLLDVTAAAGLCDDGYLMITDGTSAGAGYAILTQTVGTAASVDAIVTLQRPLHTALSASSVGIMYASPFFVQIGNHANPTAECAIGGAPIAVATATPYFWAKTWGLFPAIAGVATTVAGSTIQVAEDVSGATQVTVAADALPGSIAGVAPSATADTLGACIYLKCIP